MPGLLSDHETEATGGEKINFLELSVSLRIQHLSAEGKQIDSAGIMPEDVFDMWLYLGDYLKRRGYKIGAV